MARIAETGVGVEVVARTHWAITVVVSENSRRSAADTVSGTIDAVQASGDAGLAVSTSIGVESSSAGADTIVDVAVRLTRSTLALGWAVTVVTGVVARLAVSVLIHVVAGVALT